MANEHDDDRWDGAEDEGPGAEEALPGVFKRAVMVLFQPGELFRALSAQPRFFAIALLSAVISLVGMAAVPADAFRNAMMEGAREAGADQATLERMAQVPDLLLQIGPAMFAAFIGLVAPVLATALTWFLFRLIRRDESTFRQQLAVNAHAMFVGTVGFCATLPLIITNLDPEARFSVALLLPFLSDGFVQAWLAKLDLFWLWMLVVGGLGLSVLDERRSWRSTAMVLVGLWLAVTAVTAGLTVLAG